MRRSVGTAEYSGGWNCHPEMKKMAEGLGWSLGAGSVVHASASRSHLPKCSTLTPCNERFHPAGCRLVTCWEAQDSSGPQPGLAAVEADAGSGVVRTGLESSENK